MPASRSETIGSVLRFVNLLFCGLLAGVVLTHALEWPGKLVLTGDQWLAVQHHLYGGYATFGAVAELLTLVLNLVLGVWLLLRRRPRGWVFLGAAALVAAMLAIFAFGLQPINLRVSTFTARTLPADWRLLLDRWSTYHTISFCLALAAFAVLLMEALRRARRPAH
ncbi:MAG: hypothetical protein ACREQM_10140 [Candidatus Dormibacteraceae bacterium]